MGSLIYYGALFLAKVLDNALSTTKTILIQRSRWLLAGIAVVLSDFIYFWLTKRIVSGDNNWAILIVSLAGGVGCALACLFSEKLLKDRTYVNVIMSDNLEAMFRFDRLPENMSTMDARSVRTELSKIRDVANVISADMAKVLDKNRQPVERRDEAR